MGKGMKAGKTKKPGMNNQMAQMQMLQARMDEAQAKIEAMEEEASAGGGAVTVKVNGKHEMVSIEIKPEVLDPDDVEMLQDLIIAATNEANRAMDEAAGNAMSGVTAGMGLPAGMF